MLTALGPRQALLDHVARAAGELGLRTALVGGAIVDLLKGRLAKDLDVVVQGDAPALAAVLAARHGGEVVTHSAFGTATWTTGNGEPVDLITARQETYAAPAALPDVTPGTLEQDLGRRDFTVLCMALELETGVLLDPAGGQQDLADGLLRVQHDRSFVDDPTRVWRAARWGARLGLQPTPGTVAAMALARDLGAHQALGIERLGQEVHRCLADGRAAALFGSVAAWGWLCDLHPELPDHTPNVLADAQDRTHLSHLARGGEPYPVVDAGWLALGGLVPPRDRADLLRLVPGGGARWSLWSQGTQQVVGDLAALAGDPTRLALGRQLQRRVPAVRAALAAALPAPWDPLTAWWEQQGRHVRSAVDGHALMAAGVPKGPALGLGLQAALEAAWDDHAPAAQHRAALAAAGPRPA